MLLQSEFGVDFLEELLLYVVLIHSTDKDVSGAVERILRPHYDSVGALHETETCLQLDQILDIVFAEHFLHALHYVVRPFEMTGTTYADLYYHCPCAVLLFHRLHLIGCHRLVQLAETAFSFRGDKIVLFVAETSEALELLDFVIVEEILELALASP